ncbi:MAG: PD40 domain-containing protein [Chloracidobacterium sp.]|nr:PD40 domain-containing protein [Chloracidobacterium sp.]
MDEQVENLVEFGDFRLDLIQKILFRNSEPVALPPKVLDVLCLLVKRQGAIVSKTELMETVWADSFVEESNLTQSIYTLRRVLGKNTAGKDLIDTIPRRGYRLAVPINRTGNDAAVMGRRSSDKAVGSKYRRIALPVGIGLAAIVAVTLLGGYIYSNRRSQSASIEKVKFQKLTFTGDIAFPVISPDGQSFAYIRENAINLQDIATGSSIKLNIPGHDHFGNLQFSNEGESIFFRNEDSFDAAGDIFKVSRFGGPAKLIADRVWSTVGLSPDSRSLAFVRFYPKAGEWALLLKDLNSGIEQKLLARNLPYTIYRRGFPAWSPDGTRIAIIEQTPDQLNISRIVIVNSIDGQAETLSTPQFIQIEQVGWSPDSKRLLITGRENNRFFQLWDMDLRSSEIRPITNDLSIYRNLTISADGKTILACQNSIYSHIWTADASDLQNQKQITFGNLNRDGTSGLTWSPEGRIVYTTRITGNIDIWSITPGNGARNQLTENAGTKNENPFVTADGKYIYYESTRTGRQHIWRAGTDGSDPTQITFADNETDFFPVVSPDGNTLYYIQRTPKSNIIWRQSLADGKREMITQPGKLSPGRFLSISSDGRYLLFDDIKDDKKNDDSEIVIVDLLNGGEPRFVIIGTASAPVTISADGHFVDYYEHRPESSKFWRQPIDTPGERKLLFELPKIRIESFAWSRDGKTLALARGRSDNDAIVLTGF